MLLSAAADGAAIERLGRMLRDPRNGARVGAATALRRLALSAEMAGREDLPDAISSWLASGKLPPDASLDLVRLVGEAGFVALSAVVRDQARAGRLHAQAVDEAVARLRQCADEASWEGMWVSDGRDVLEIGEAAGASTWSVIAGGRCFSGGGVSSGLTAEPVRRIWAPRPGGPEARYPAVQRGGFTWWRCDGKGLADAVDERWDTFGPPDLPALAHLRTWLAAEEGPGPMRSRALLSWRLGHFDEALGLLEDLALQKKPRGDVFFWLGRVAAELGKRDRAVEALDTFLDKSGKKAPWRKEAEELRARLS
jgi:hypothetical protein